MNTKTEAIKSLENFCEKCREYKATPRFTTLVLDDDEAIVLIGEANSPAIIAERGKPINILLAYWWEDYVKVEGTDSMTAYYAKMLLSYPTIVAGFMRLLSDCGQDPEELEYEELYGTLLGRFEAEMNDNLSVVPVEEI